MFAVIYQERKRKIKQL